jgi:hypothetical protein
MSVILNPFSGQLQIGSNSGGCSSGITIGKPVIGGDINSLLGVNSLGNLTDITLTNGQLLIGSTGNFPIPATISGTSNQVTVTSGAGTITLSLPQSISTTSSPSFANVSLSPSGTLDTTSVGTLAIGTGNANVINIGNSGATVNIQGTTLYENVTQLQVTDPLITLNKGGGTGSASNSGIQVEENAIITGYVETSSDRNSWIFKAPNSSGIITLTPGTSGFTIDSGSLLSTKVTNGVAYYDGTNLVTGANLTFNGSGTLTSATGLKTPSLIDSTFYT